MNKLVISAIEKSLTIIKLSNYDSVPDWVYKSHFYCMFKNSDEHSVVCDTHLVPPSVQAEKNWFYFKIKGPIPFHMTGVLSSVLNPLAEKKIGIFAISSYDTDYILVKAEKFSAAKEALKEVGHKIV